MTTAENNHTQNQRPPCLYRGRFAPSPSGELHFGSLVTALASYLDAKSQQGSWLVRIEDIDPPREQPGASANILTTLESFGLRWDEQVLYQSQQTDYYLDLIHSLDNQSLTYACQCSRAQIKAMGGIYQGQCKNLKLKPTAANPCAIRVINRKPCYQFNDLIQGHIELEASPCYEDFIIKRKDGLFAYQLAVVADDLFQNISHVIRGCDLIEPTARQLSFYHLLDQAAPLFGHVPLAVTEQGYKLSKQNKALALDNSNPCPPLIAALKFLGLPIHSELADLSLEQLLAWAIDHWSLTQVPNKQQIAIKNQSTY